MQQFIIFIYCTRLVLSYQIQDNLSLYYNMAAANGKKYGLKYKDISENTIKSVWIPE